MDFSDIIKLVFDSNRRIVLVEKAPFLVIETIISTRYYMVRRISEGEWQQLNKIKHNFVIDVESKNEIYRIIDFGLKGFPTNEKYEIGNLILKKNCELTDSFQQLKPVRKNESLTVWK